MRLLRHRAAMRLWLGMACLLALGGCGDDEPATTSGDAGHEVGVAAAGRGGDASAGRMSAIGSGSGGGGGVTSDAGVAIGGSASGHDAPSGPIVGAAGSGEGPPAVRYVGRVDLTDPAGGKFAWSGSGVVARFRGSKLSVKFAGGQEYTALIDGAVLPSKLVVMNGPVEVVSDLSDAVHSVELYRRTEASQGVSQFLGFTFSPGGALLAPPPAPDRRIELIGDSISVGYGNEGADQNCGFTPQTENHYLSYGAIAARAVGSELHTIAWSGRGVVCNYGDDAQSCTDPLPTIYDRALPTQTDSHWDFSRYQPDAVIINLGTNDYSTSSDPSEADFTAAYRKFLEHIRSQYPKALILCTCGPLLYGDELEHIRSYIANAVTATGDANIKTFDIASQSASDGLGCDYHPSIKTHQKMADLVAAVLKRELGW